MKEEYVQKLEDIQEKISRHPMTRVKNIKKGVENLNNLITDTDYHISIENGYDVENYLLNYKEIIKYGIEDYRPGSIWNLKYTCTNGFKFYIMITVHSYQEHCEVILKIKNSQHNIEEKYDLNYIYEKYEEKYEEEIDRLYTNLGIKYSGIADFEIFKPFFKIDLSRVYEYARC
tara:strand:+ start:135 stop:656 length:522 start_codon:yes stop_codon:yes gene_type:complete